MHARSCGQQTISELTKFMATRASDTLSSLASSLHLAPFCFLFSGEAIGTAEKCILLAVQRENTVVSIKRILQ